MDTVIYKGKPYTKCGYANLYVNNYGIGAVCWAESKSKFRSDKKMLKFIHWKTNSKTGKRYITVNGENHDLDILIGRYCGDKNGFHGDDGRAWDISYVDGDVNHCYQGNLEWVPRPHKIDKSTGKDYIELHLEGANVMMYETGDLYCGDTLHTPASELIDADTNQWYVTEPFYNFVWQGKRYYADDLMKMGNYVNGDMGAFQNPVILHRDYDFKNFSADNLEWCDSSDPRYAEYMKKKCEDRDSIAAELNKKH